MRDNDAPVRFGFVLVPGFSLLSFSCALDVLRAARLEAPEEGFSWTLLSPYTEHDADFQPLVQSSSGIPLAVEEGADLAAYDAVIVCGGVRSHEFLGRFEGSRLGGRLREAARAGRMVGSLSDGAFLVAAAGLFDKVRSTIHWKCQSAYREMHPELDVRASILEIDAKRMSCAGGTASLDLALHLVARTLGWDAAARIADNHVHDRMRGEDEVQHASAGYRFAGRATGLGGILTDMEAFIETPLSIAQLAERRKMSVRQLDRIFRKHLGVSPSEHYRELRLLRAAGLLRQSDLSVAEIAVACGFSSASHMNRYFAPRFGCTPTTHRRQHIQ